MSGLVCRLPSQRISRYPLFLKAMLDHVAKESEEGDHLRGEVTRHMQPLRMWHTIAVLVVTV